MTSNTPLYDRVVAISKDYLGPAADRFMRRQISTHLNKEPENLQPEDINELVNWVKLTFALLTDDSKLIDSFSDELYSLSREPVTNHGRRHGNT